MKIIWFRGATAYEFQIGPFWMMWCHLKGNYWKWKPWRRFSAGVDWEA
ncbi:hypothetical protein [Rhizobium azibense]|uniref:Uncharacterized protein n=1 Tax=Rhizobium azibense TaxID=1136135 RepID=A0A4R3REX0_9HYPH|nr:hypothetical protein [Rhizobium azibense]TCU34088.1 hypothetical protein EV129_11371 [Rhizobium azibense]